MDYKSRQGVTDDCASFLDRLSNFFSRSEAPNPTTRGRVGPSPPIGPVLTIAADTRRTLTGVSPWKVKGPDKDVCSEPALVS